MGVAVLVVTLLSVMWPVVAQSMPDLAIGRLPAKTAAELSTMVSKILAYETNEIAFEAPFRFVADDSDRAGDFESDAEEMSGEEEPS